jgi:hypothetical protein
MIAHFGRHRLPQQMLQNTLGSIGRRENLLQQTSQIITIHMGHRCLLIKSSTTS